MQRLKQQQQQQQAMMQQALMQQQSLPSRTPHRSSEPIPSGNLPPGFDPTSCRSVYVGNVHIQVTEPLLQEVFASTGPVESCKLIRKEQSSYGFVHYFDRRSAGLAILSLNGRHLFGQPIKVNWAYASGQREDTSAQFNIFVGDLSPEVTDALLFNCFSVYPKDARVMWDQKTGRSRGFGFVSFRNQQVLILLWLFFREMAWYQADSLQLGNKGATSGEDKMSSDSKSVVELASGVSEDGKDTINGDAPENNAQYTTVYVGNLGPEVSQADLHRHFYSLGAGVIEEVRVQRDKEAALAIQLGNTHSYLGGRQMKPNPLPPPGPAPIPGFSASDLLAYERQLAMSKMAGMSPMMHHPQGQHALKQAAMGATGSNQAIYDGGFQNAQQLMYYQ
ncbi:hypothetical protein Bca52824_078887 [Brassica carinata]|uniref:RRM domain-containing protein n=1 Tax=Brassica carinata TaxID=52824 RepID=A0A8X7Q017_BRACI|nr:hypothetical protein Bca52824_078887 [Brassica carinata]